MKKNYAFQLSIILIIAVAAIVPSNAQVPQQLNYQAVARMANGDVLPNQFINIELSILDGSQTGTIVYQETDTATTNQFGLFAVAIGTGQVLSGTNLGTVSWGTGNKYLHVRFDPAGGNNFADMGTTQLLSVPYALYAQTSGGGVIPGVWNLTGNSGTQTDTNYIGTNDNVALRFKVNGQPAGIIEADTSNSSQSTAFGYQALMTEGVFSTFTMRDAAFGYQALSSQQSTAQIFGGNGGNSAFGYQAMDSNISGSYNTAVGCWSLLYNSVGDSNTAIGSQAMYQNRGGSQNTAIGLGALRNNTGNSNTAVGVNAMGIYFNVSVNGSANVAVGSGALFGVQSRSFEVAIGDSALYSDGDINSTIGYNTAVGYQALFGNFSGKYNTAVGFETLNAGNGGLNTALGCEALQNNNLGEGNVAVGAFALQNSNTNMASYNTALGYDALNANTSGSDNTATGKYALRVSTTGNYNTANGSWALDENITGYNNTAMGYKSLVGNSTGNGNTAVGNQSLATGSGNYNVAIGDSALCGNSFFGGGSYNIAVGSMALASNYGGEQNTALGFEALFANTTGSGNVAVGDSALYNLDGSYNTAVGSSAMATSNFSNATVLGFGAKVDAGNKVVVGNTSVSSIGGQVGWTIFSDKRVKDNVQQNVPGLEFISKLQPVTWHYNVDSENELLGGSANNKNWQGKYDIEKMTFSGFIAQDVDVAAQSIGYDFSGVDKQGGIWGLRYSDFVPALVKGMQEQQAIILKLQQQINDQNSKNQQQLDEMKKEIEELRGRH